MAQTTLSEVEQHLRSTIQNLYVLISQTADHRGPETTTPASINELHLLIENLALLSRSAPSLDIEVPPEALTNIQAGRNPDIYTREMIETVMRYNQLLKGRSEAFASFRDEFARHLAISAPELKDQVARVVTATGGKFPNEGEEDVFVKAEDSK